MLQSPMSLEEQLEYRGSNSSFRTRIFADTVDFVDKNTVTYQGTTPAPDESTNRGAVGYLIQNGKIIDTRRATTDGMVTFSKSIYDFESEEYQLGYGPFHSAFGTNVVAVAATIDTSDFTTFDPQPSICARQGRAQSTFLRARYELPKGLFDFGADVTIYIVEGKILKGQGSAITKVFKIDKDSYKGSIKIEYPNGTLEAGKDYTVCMGIFSSVRQIAGFGFKYG
ncbi:MAG: hypothetical protein AAF570_04135 [Bacteroidota bacterium]